MFNMYPTRSPPDGGGVMYTVSLPNGICNDSPNRTLFGIVNGFDSKFRETMSMKEKEDREQASNE